MNTKIFSYAKDALIIILLLWLTMRGGHSTPGVAKIDTMTVVKETHHDSTVYVTLKPTTIRQTTTVPVKYLPDSTYEGLKKQYMERLDSLLATVSYNDTLKIDSIGWVNVQDSISMNRNVGRKYKYDIRQIETTHTITIREPYRPRNQFYLGAQGDVNVKGSVESLGLGLMFKNKKDRAVGLGVGWNFPAKTPQINFSFYSKLKL